METRAAGSATILLAVALASKVVGRISSKYATTKRPDRRSIVMPLWISLEMAAPPEYPEKSKMTIPVEGSCKICSKWFRSVQTLIEGPVKKEKRDSIYLTGSSKGTRITTASLVNFGFLAW